LWPKLSSDFPQNFRAIDIFRGHFFCTSQPKIPPTTQKISMSVLPASTFYAFGTEESYSYPRRRRRRRIHPQPGQDLHLLSLGKGGRFTARGSGPEPKIKSHLFPNQ
jgi:hypothetical protein